MDKSHKHTGKGLSCDICGRHKDNAYHVKSGVEKHKALQERIKSVKGYGEK